jgi:SAM-dependent methyltransferase
VTGTTEWGRKAAELYQPDYARRYRAHDDEFEASVPCRQFADWLAAVCRSFAKPIDVLDLGCGTGRYFWALVGVHRLVGLDASAPMLAEARRPFNADRVGAASVSLIEGDLFDHDFPADGFDLVYSIGVLAEHVPLNAAIVARVHRWLRPGGRFAFTTVHPESPSIPRTVGRRLGRMLLPVTAGALRHRLHTRLLSAGMYADERRIQELLEYRFAIESLVRFESEAHLHGLCVARKPA